MKDRTFIRSKGLRPSPWYSHAVRTGNLIYTAGLTAADPSTGIASGDIKDQTRRVLRNLSEVLREAGGGLEHIVKVNAYLADINEFMAYNEVYIEFFRGDNKPARTTVQVGKFNNNVRVEIDAVAIIP